MMTIYAVKFTYDNSASKSQLSCFVLAESEEDARNQFNRNIRKIFYSYYDECNITAVTKLSMDSGILFSKGGTVWEATDEYKVMW